MKTKEALDFALGEYHKLHGNNAKLENIEEFATVFPDGIMIISRKDDEMNIKILLGKPFYADFDIIEEGDLINE